MTELPSRFVAPGTAAALLGVSRSTLLRWETQGKLTPRRLHGAGHRRYLLSDLRGCLSAPVTQDKPAAARLEHAA
jgi:predicted site-specific integrase-resolvase